ncbi:hypothetical protein VP1G_04641 [Cytospora mali]|uniref:Uncharacterized protein n=1 Tax=Cytospora mali TaxID=578113 RepID=A0A194V077_CYTMA|nr:hypothetical protein VP1G_04641 [Valsa mali var. pyri (nom. inval.)]
MLPFRNVPAEDRWSDYFLATDEFFNIGVVDHPSVANWWICADGSVRVRNTEIFLSSEHYNVGEQNNASTVVQWSLVKQLKKQLIVPQVNYNDISSTLDLGQQMQTIAGAEGRVLAVVLYSDPFSQHGIFLYGLRSAPDSTHCFVKIGTFSISRPETKTTHDTTVDWLIL